MTYSQINDLIERLKQLSITELRSLLASVFPFARFEQGRSIDYLGSEGLALSLTYSARGNLGHRTPGPGLTADSCSRLEEALRSRSGPPDDHFRSQYSFSDRPVRGWWRYRDRFQLMPPPPGAPLPPELFGEWPFLMEFRFRSSSGDEAVISAGMREGNTLRLLFPVLIKGPKFKPNFYSPAKHWFIPMEPDGMPLGLPVYGQEFYGVPGAPLGGPDLTVMPPDMAAPVVPAGNYYSVKARTGDEVIEIPNNLESLLDTYYGLAPELQAAYRRACYWFNLGRFLFPYSASTSFVALVVAIESLLEKEGPHVCVVCRKDHHPSITANFREFLNEYVPAGPEREQFYATRSSIAHGSALLSVDIRDEWGVEGFRPAALQERQEQDALWQVTQVGLVNWLASKVGGTGDQGIQAGGAT